MNAITVAGAGAFGTALGVALAQAGREVTLWCRDAGQATAMRDTRENSLRLPGIRLPEHLRITTGPIIPSGVVLLCVPTQALRGFLSDNPVFADTCLVACCKGAELSTGKLPTGIIAEAAQDARPAVLTGPGFAAEIASGKPTALTLAADPAEAAGLQALLSTPSIRLYRTEDLTGAQLGGALKNVIAIACGIAIGAGLGESARAAVMTRGFAEMMRFAAARGGRAETLHGLSGLGDLALTCTSAQSRNFAHGLALGGAHAPPRGRTVEGAATARAIAAQATALGLDMPITAMVSAVLEGKVTVGGALDALLSRPLREEG